MQEDVDRSGSCGVQPARDELQGDSGLAQFICSGAEAHISRGSMPLHGHRVSAHAKLISTRLCKDICDARQVVMLTQIGCADAAPVEKVFQQGQPNSWNHNRCITDA